MLKLNKSTVDAIVADLQASHKAAAPTATPINWQQLITTLLPIILQLLAALGPIIATPVAPTPTPTPAKP